jgi:hypothetical protein
VSLAELNEALEALQRAVSVNDCCEQENLRLGNLGDPSDE